MNLELILQSFYDAVLMDLNIFITVIPSMFVIKSNAMEKFVSYLPLGKAVIAELNDLSAVLFANLGETSKFNWIILNEDFINIFWSCRPERTVMIVVQVCFVGVSVWEKSPCILALPDSKTTTHLTIH